MKFKTQTHTLADPEVRRGDTHIHNHMPSAFGAVFSKVFALFVTLIFIWMTGTFLFRKIGVRQPDHAMAYTLLVGLGIIFLGGVASFLLNNFLDKYFAFQKEIKDKETQQMRYKQLMLQSAVADTRPNTDTTRLNSLILQIMEEAYAHHAKSGKFRGAWRPWSRRSAGAMVLLALSESEPVGETLAVKAKDFLLKHNVIVDEQLNLAQYPDMTAIQKLLYAPVLLPVSNASARVSLVK